MKKVRFPKKELNLWLKNHLRWNHKEWLMLIDTLGKSGFSYLTQNKELIDNIYDRGRYTLNWNANSHSSGVYFIELKAGKSRIIKKITLIK